MALHSSVVRNGIDCYKWHWPFTKGTIAYPRLGLNSSDLKESILTEGSEGALSRKGKFI